MSGVRYTAKTVAKSYGAQGPRRVQVAHLLRVLMDANDLQMDELEELTGMCQSSLRAWVHALRAAQVVRVSSRPPNASNAPSMAYSLNPDRKPDTPTKPPQTKEERSERHRKNAQARRKERLLPRADTRNPLLTGSWIQPSKENHDA